MDASSYAGTRQLDSDTSARNSIDFLVRMILSEVATATVARVHAVDTDAGTVDVQPLVAMIDGRGDGMPHGTVYALPYARLQGGTNAVIIDPVVGDIGIVVFASRDISSVKVNKAPALPGSRRQFDMADGMYIGGILNETPTQFVRMTEDGIEVISPVKVTVVAPEVEIDGDLNVTGSVTVPTGDVTAGAISLKTHRHGGVTTGGGNTGGSIP